MWSTSYAIFLETWTIALLASAFQRSNARGSVTASAIALPSCRSQMRRSTTFGRRRHLPRIASSSFRSGLQTVVQVQLNGHATIWLRENALRPRDDS